MYVFFCILYTYFAGGFTGNTYPSWEWIVCALLVEYLVNVPRTPGTRGLFLSSKLFWVSISRMDGRVTYEKRIIVSLHSTYWLEAKKKKYLFPLLFPIQKCSGPKIFNKDQTQNNKKTIQ